LVEERNIVDENKREIIRVSPKKRRDN